MIRGARWVGLLLAVSLLSVLSPSAAQAGCHTSCTSVQPPQCLGCGFLIYSNVMCLRADCNFCSEEYCWAGLPGSKEQLAAGPEGAGREHRVTVQVLAPRT